MVSHFLKEKEGEGVREKLFAYNSFPFSIFCQAMKDAFIQKGRIIFTVPSLRPLGMIKI